MALKRTIPVTIAAALCAAAVSAATQAPTPEQQAARAELKELGYQYTVEDFFQAGFDSSPAVGLFLKAGMAADTPSPATGHSLLMSLLGEAAECDDARLLVVMDALLAGHADPNQWVEGGRVDLATPLLRAYPCLDQMEPLFAAGARLDVRGMDQWDRTTVGDDLMSLAIADEEQDVLNLLIAKGYDARKHRDRWLKEAAGKPDILRLLRATGVKAGPADRAQAKRPH